MPKRHNINWWLDQAVAAHAKLTDDERGYAYPPNVYPHRHGSYHLAWLLVRSDRYEDAQKVNRGYDGAITKIQIAERLVRRGKLKEAERSSRSSRPSA